MPLLAWMPAKTPQSQAVPLPQSLCNANKLCVIGNNVLS